MIKTFDPFLPEWLSDRVQRQLLSPDLDWHFPGYGDAMGDIAHTCFSKTPFKAGFFEDWKGVDSLIYSLDYWLYQNKDWFQFDYLSRCLINFYTPGQNTGWHKDIPPAEGEDFYTMVHYVNDCDGGTEFEDQKIPHKENTAIFFPSSVFHSPITCTSPRRISVNWIFKGKIINEVG